VDPLIVKLPVKIRVLVAPALDSPEILNGLLDEIVALEGVTDSITTPFPVIVRLLTAILESGSILNKPVPEGESLPTVELGLRIKLPLGRLMLALRPKLMLPEAFSVNVLLELEDMLTSVPKLISPDAPPEINPGLLLEMVMFEILKFDNKVFA